jgi:alkylation response protein AidB-like acyl-CoA dehydrogenase
MHFAFTDDQKMLRDTVREVLQRECPPEVVRAVWEGSWDGVQSVWNTLAETGVLGMAASEEAGGMDMQAMDFVLPLEETGYAALPGPVAETLAIGIPLLEVMGTDAQKDRWLSPAIAGQVKLAVAFEGQSVLPHASVSDVVLVQRGKLAFCVPTAELKTSSEQSVDRTRDLASITGAPAEAHQARTDVDLVAAFAVARERAALAAAAQLVGLSRRMLDMTVAYAKDRVQFGKPIGAQQAVKHRLANALIQQEFARPLVYRAAWALSTGQPDVELSVSMAKIYAGEAAKFVAKECLQVHGAIGYTIECDLHMWMKRAWALAASYGDAAYHRARVGRHIF